MQAAPLGITNERVSLPGVSLPTDEIGGKVVCTSCAIVTGRVAGVYWVPTVENHRRRGLGEAMTWRAIRAGVEKGPLRAIRPPGDGLTLDPAGRSNRTTGCPCSRSAVHAVSREAPGTPRRLESGS